MKYYGFALCYFKLLKANSQLSPVRRITNDNKFKVIKDNKFWVDKTVFVTGATGLLGGALVKSLIERNASVVALVRDWVPEAELIQSSFFVEN